MKQSKVLKLLSFAKGEEPKQGMVIILRRKDGHLIVETTPQELNEITIIRIILTNRGDEEFFQKLDIERIIKEEHEKIKMSIRKN